MFEDPLCPIAFTSSEDVETTDQSQRIGEKFQIVFVIDGEELFDECLTTLTERQSIDLRENSRLIEGTVRFQQCSQVLFDHLPIGD